MTGRKALAGLWLALAPLTLTGCPATSSYAGIPLVPGAAGAELQDLARRAQTGDKYAQLELGIRYEEGRGLAQDLRRAETLYRQAASDSGGTAYVYAPPVRAGNQGRVVSINQGPEIKGLTEAEERWLRLRALLGKVQ